MREGLAHVLRELEANRLETRKARAMIYGLSVLASVIQGSDLEERVRQLEAAIAGGTPRGHA